MISLREQLLIVPTTLEQNWIQNQLDSLLQGGLCWATCGVGLVESAITVARLISVYQPKQLWLIGIAGSLSESLQIGLAYEFSQVSCYGIGVGCGTEYRLPNELGWQKMMKFGVQGTVSLNPLPSNLELLSVAAASADLDEAKLKLTKFPNAAAEDMEAYSVALQCSMFGVKCRVIRGISNRAGDREHSRWKVGKAMGAAFELFSSQLQGEA